MKNPGTATPLKTIDDPQILRELSKLDEYDDAWYEFSSDSTINCVGELFAQYYGKHSREELSGLIQIFNLFYIKEGNLSKALKKDNENKAPFKFNTDADIVNYDLQMLSFPVYLGFADLAFNKKYQERARMFFDKALSLGSNYLNPVFHNNKFVHPQYLMLYGKNNVNCIRIRTNFINNQFDR